MTHFLLGRELPAIFTLCLVGAYFGFTNDQPAFAVWLLFAALWCAMLWLLLLPHQPRQAASQPDKTDNHHNHSQHGQRRRTSRRASRRTA